VLCYHSVGSRACGELRRWELTPAFFEDQMAYLRDAGYAPVPLATLARWLREPGADMLPDRPVVVTFDDAYANFEQAFAILARHDVPVTLFVPTAHVGDRSSWYATQAARDRMIMSWAALADVHASGVEVGSHAHRHVPLDEQPIAVARSDIARSKALLEDKLGAPVQAFAYPYGYFDAAVRRAVRDSGFRYACAVKNWTSGPGDDHLAIARIFPPTDGDLVAFARVLLHGNRSRRRTEAVSTKAWRLARRVRSGLRRRP
jgi:peptidoglycan/xylan/chitin deacetylase (PgdA/CDA1 family)